ncbi:MAG: hypothetical protein AB1750_01605 [Chloroflexota bacterium]
MISRLFLILVLLAALLSACGPNKVNFTGQWTANVGIVNLTQNGDKVTGSVEGYGGSWKFDLAGTVSESTLTFEGETPLGPLAIVLSGDGKTFRSANPAVGFCGSRDTVLPDGCGFSGTWKIQADLVPPGSVAKLTQTISSVTGAVYGPDGTQIASLNATVNWGKGWQAVGVNEWGDFVLSMTANEKAFELAAGGQFGMEWCGLREGETTAFVMYFDCAAP